MYALGFSTFTVTMCANITIRNIHDELDPTLSNRPIFYNAWQIRCTIHLWYLSNDTGRCNAQVTIRSCCHSQSRIDRDGDDRDTHPPRNVGDNYYLRSIINFTATNMLYRQFYTYFYLRIQFSNYYRPYTDYCVFKESNGVGPHDNRVRSDWRKLKVEWWVVAVAVLTIPHYYAVWPRAESFVTVSISLKVYFTVAL